MADDLLAYRVWNTTQYIFAQLSNTWAAFGHDSRSFEQPERLVAILSSVIVALPVFCCASRLLLKSIRTFCEFLVGSIFVLGLIVAVDSLFYQSSGIFPLFR